MFFYSQGMTDNIIIPSFKIIEKLFLSDLIFSTTTLIPQT